MNRPTPDPNGKREQNKARNRAVLLDAARAVFTEIGYDAATVRDIVAATDLAPGTFYNYFPDKQSVLLALIEDAAHVGKARIRKARAEAVSVEDFVVRGFRAYFEFIAHDPTVFELMRRNLGTLRSLGIDETGFAKALLELRDDLEQWMSSGRMPRLPLSYWPAVVGAIAFEVGAKMVAHDPPDIEGATKFASQLCLGGLERMVREAAIAPKGKKAR